MENAAFLKSATGKLSIRCWLDFENGEIIESGSHDELMSRKGKYYKMFVKQGENYQNWSADKKTLLLVITCQVLCWIWLFFITTDIYRKKDYKPTFSGKFVVFVFGVFYRPLFFVF